MRVVIVLALVGAVLAVPRQLSRIVGGSPATIEKYPFIASLQFNRWGIFHSPRCGGSLITRTTVLSAAHCFYQAESPVQWRVRLGSANSTSGGTVHDVSHIIMHENFVYITKLNDVALLRLRVAASLSSTIALAYIAGTNYNLPDNALVYAAGWGRLSEDKPQQPEELLHIEINVINHELCRRRYALLQTLPDYKFMPHVTPEMLCHGILNVGGKNTCLGDSGGPITHNKNVIVGVISWTFGCAHPFFPGVSARVSSYTTWIYDHSVS
ncbi:trypsin, alkaline C-like [Nymphalis io]|uniref:trypsin, alkaline C-like n=1 Tax=Inachis io TaxID=171585 RepID=UPI002168A4EA|nr:trypsin, alkaline C-like [Nymphalis io]